MTSEIIINAIKENDTPADRLKAARNTKNLTRKQLAELTGIPVKTIEKYEYGGMEPNISRLHSLCEILGITPEAVIGIEMETSGPHETPEEISASGIHTSKFMEDCLLHLRELDMLRQGRFRAYPVKARAHFEALQNALRLLDGEELGEIAELRGIVIDEEQIDEVEEAARRILDTAVFGIDIFSIELKAL
ncbi:helix-turn-helix domain-containing protein [Sneathiella sp. HT1-7]|uniref:helix-turn-helix domain-containing protein n=1 Tax=Sneathiella sp. HT1-7 TaxID=2887192 RepID=UPI001D146A47|nr:helix-turn-helix transcriptional regulator [Sneathiella sp. HT1-7]MCC3303825.1 helix-turn-helix domain-containing protein [Sneathiella sp. HT1-7]